MILFDTPYDEVIRTMLDEWEKVDYAIRKAYARSLKRNSIRNRILLPPTAPKIEKYTVPASNNTYSIVINYENDVAEAWGFLKSNGDWGHRKVYVLQKNGARCDEPRSAPWTLDIYTGHFLSRYRERSCAGDWHGDELVARYLARNKKHGIAIPASFVNPAIDDDKQTAIIVDEGVCFGESRKETVNGMPVYINENRTFIHKDKLFQEQKNSIFAADLTLKYAKLKKALSNGAESKELYEIIKSGIFQPFRN